MEGCIPDQNGGRVRICSHCALVSRCHELSCCSIIDRARQLPDVCDNLASHARGYAGVRKRRFSFNVLGDDIKIPSLERRFQYRRGTL